MPRKSPLRGEKSTWKGLSPAAFPVSPLTPSGDKNFVISFSRVHSGGFRLRQAWCPGHPWAFESEGEVQSGAAGCPPPSGRPGSGGSSPPGSLLLLPSPPRLTRLPTACRQTPVCPSVRPQVGLALFSGASNGPLLPHPLPPTTPRSPNSAAAASTLLGCLPSSPTALS